MSVKKSLWKSEELRNEFIILLNSKSQHKMQDLQNQTTDYLRFQIILNELKVLPNLPNSSQNNLNSDILNL